MCVFFIIIIIIINDGACEGVECDDDDEDWRYMRMMHDDAWLWYLRIHDMMVILED